MLEKHLQLQTELYCNKILYFDFLSLLSSKRQGKQLDLNIGLDLPVGRTTTYDTDIQNYMPVNLFCRLPAHINT